MADKIYDKISGVFLRDLTTKKVIIGEYSKPEFKLLENVTWVGTEKIDGTNIRIIWDGYSIKIAGRTEKSSFQGNKLLPYLESKFNCPEIFEQIFGEKSVILFGEGYGEKIQGNYLGKDGVSFILFDVFVNGNYLNREDVEDIAQKMNLDVVPIRMKGTLKELVELVENDMKSELNENVIAEGLVARPEIELKSNSGRIITKIKYKDLKKGEIKWKN